MIPKDAGEWMDEDDFDARSINDMATSFQSDDMFPETPFMNILSAWDQLQPHPDTGTMIEFCWENPAAWAILAGDVDKDWFMEQLAIRDVEPAP